MKNIIIIIIAALLLMSGCGNNIEINHDEEPGNVENLDIEINDELDENTASQSEDKDGSGEQNITEETTMMIGTWHEVPFIGSADSQRYHFFPDGKYIFEYSQYDTEKRILSKTGTWTFENGLLTLIVNSMVTVEGGEESAESLLPGDDNNEYAIINGTIRIVDIKTPESEEYILENFYYDIGNTPGDYLTVLFNETRYWKYTDDPSVYLDGPYADGDIYNPW